MGKKEAPKEPKKQNELAKAAKGMFYGMALHGMVTYALRLRIYHYGRHAGYTCATTLLQPQTSALRGPLLEDVEANLA